MNKFQPTESEAIKVASALIHAEEYMSPGGHPADKAAFESLMNDPGVREWLHHLESFALLPVKRSKAGSK